MSSRSVPILRQRIVPASLAVGCALAALIGCDRAPPEPSTAGPASTATAEPNEDEPAPEAACTTPFSSTPAAPKTSLAECPTDPDGRPTMPRARLAFVDAPTAPQLNVEVAENDPHRSHGLMFRPTLADEEGMLFSWPSEGYRSFWMHNTCLALDMLFIDSERRIVGVLEQVPPWNDLPRRVTCPSAYVLEVRAGFARAYGVAPGQHISITPQP
ncbi:MAG TPA: DUF192 domain-containing protein [Polyangiaceae bacterium]|nr:DUF192 domain-containing protein [Polyangiaceae bacterium]